MVSGWTAGLDTKPAQIGRLCITLNHTTRQRRYLSCVLTVAAMAPTPKTERMKRLLTVRFADDEMELLKAAAEQRCQPMSELVREALRAVGVPVAAW